MNNKIQKMESELELVGKGCKSGNGPQRTLHVLYSIIIKINEIINKVNQLNIEQSGAADAIKPRP